MHFLESLNEAQQQAVTAPLSPILVLAGPGTGKTRTLVGRILYLIQHHHIAPYKILAVTFTNKAKEEMKHRLQDELGDAASDLHIGTFHRFCMTVLREHYKEAGLPKQFSIADETTQLITLSRVSRIQDPKSLNTVLNAISSYRLNKANLNPNFQGIAIKWMTPYHQELRKNNLIDFDQILLLTREFFARHPELVKTYRKMFDAVLVDEFQDTDPIQYAIMKSLVWEHRNIFVVADDDQSIFAWRGAHIENIDQYTRNFECQEDQVIILNKNYRSVQCIIDLATQLINCGPRFKKKQINAVFPDSEALKAEYHFLSFPDDEAEIEFIIKQIITLTQSSAPGSAGVSPASDVDRMSTFPDADGTPALPGNAPNAGEMPALPGKALRYSDIAILYPTHAIGDQLEAKLLAAHIPCQLVKRQGIFDQEDVRKIILLLKLLQNPWDDVALEQFFQLELHNDLVFEQIRSLKAKSQTFRHTLQALTSGQEEIAGISKNELRRTITTTFGIISNMISYLNQNPDLELSEFINTLCNLTVPMYTSTIHSKIQHLSDPFEIPGIKDALAKIQTAISQGNSIYVCGKDPSIVDICRYLLSKMGPTSKVVSISGDKMGSTSKVASISDTDILFCLDEMSAKDFYSAYPNILDSQIMLISPPPNLPHQGGGTSRRIHSRTANHSIPPNLPNQGGGTSSPPPLVGGESDSPLLVGWVRGRGAHLTIESPFSPVVTVFKLLQTHSSEKTPKAFKNYTILDLETTSGNIRTTGIVEIGAVKVHNGEIIGKFSTLVNPEKPITQGAYKVHHISDADVQNKRAFAELLPEFLEFVGNDVLVAHNGFGFDFPILMRFYKETTGKTLSNRRFDTLPLARRLFPGQPASVDALMQRFGIRDTGERHRALDDTIYLAQIFERLQEIERSVDRRSEHEELLDLVALGIFLEASSHQWAVGSGQSAVSSGQEPTPGHPELVEGRNEERILFQLGAKKLLSRFSELPEQFRELYEQHQADIKSLFERLSTEETGEETSGLAEIFSGRDAAIARLKDLANSFAKEPIQDAIQHFLDHTALYNSQDDIRDVNAVNLLTIHSAKGLEFPVVFVSGVEKGNLPSFYSVREEGELGEKKLNEQRRLFYVAMTRAKQKLIVTYVDKRGEYEKKRSQFLIELGIEPEEFTPDTQE